MRSVGTALGHCLLAWKSILVGLSRSTFGIKRAESELNQHWELLAEPIQTIMRTCPGLNDPYTTLKKLTRRGESISQVITLSKFQALLDTHRVLY